MSKRIIVIDNCRKCEHSWVGINKKTPRCLLSITHYQDDCPKDDTPDWCPLPSLNTYMDAHCGNCEHFRVYEGFEDEPVCCNGVSKYSAQPMDESDVCGEWEAIKDE